MISIAESLQQLASKRYLSMSDEQKADVEDVLDAAEHFAAGALPVHEFAKLSSGRMRFEALMAAPVDDPRRHSLLRAVDAVLRFQGFVLCQNGVFTPQELGELGIVVKHERDPWDEAA